MATGLVIYDQKRPCGFILHAIYTAIEACQQFGRRNGHCNDDEQGNYRPGNFSCRMLMERHFLLFLFPVNHQ